MVNLSDLVLAPCMAVWARDVTYTPPGGEPAARRGVFQGEREIVRANPDGSEFSTTAPVLGIRVSEWSPAPVQGGRIDIDGTAYSIFDTQPDGQGGVDLMLRKVLA